MNIPFLDLTRQYGALKKEIDAAILDVVESGRYIGGPEVELFEKELARYAGVAHAVGMASGTDALLAGLMALGVGEGDEVITSPFTFIATAEVICFLKAKPVFVDIDAHTYNINPDLLKKKIGKKTKCIIPVHLFGMPCDMAGVVEVACNHNLKIIEDSCECMFVKHQGRMTGSWSHIGCFSMYVAHLLTAGVGGISITNDPLYAVKMRSLVNHGRDGIYISIDDDDGLNNAELREVVERRFHFEAIGHSYRITELEAALALAQLDDWEDMIKARQDNADLLSLYLSGLQDKIQLPAHRPDTGHAMMMFPIVVRGESKWGLCQHLEKNGVETREMLRLTDQPAYEGLWNPKHYPVAEWLNECGFYCGIHQALDATDMSYIAKTIGAYFGR